MAADLLSWKSPWAAESATFEEARALRKRLLKRWQSGGEQDRALARIVKRCRKGKRCGSTECPVCERRRRRAKRERDMRVAPPQVSKVVLLRTSEIVPERIDWIWPGIIAVRRVTGLVGYPGLGKSQVAIDIAATVSTGRHWPGGASNSKASHAILLSAEDDPADTIVPRLIAAGADLRRVHVVKAVKESEGVERPFNLAVDLDLLEKDHDLQQVNLLVIDPVSAYLGQTRKRINQNQGGDVRTIQDRLATFAAKHDLAVLAVSHLNKSSGAAQAFAKHRGFRPRTGAPYRAHTKGKTESGVG